MRLVQELNGLKLYNHEPWTDDLGVVCCFANSLEVSVVADRERGDIKSRVRT